MSNLDLMLAVDEAWNDRRWDDYAALIHPDLRAFANDSPEPHDRQRHVERAMAFCATFPDARVHEPYIMAFVSEDGTSTCTVSRATGCPVGSAQGFDITMAVVTRWQDGMMIVQHAFLDEQRMAEQLAPVMT